MDPSSWAVCALIAADPILSRTLSLILSFKSDATLQSLRDSSISKSFEMIREQPLAQSVKLAPLTDAEMEEMCQYAVDHDVSTGGSTDRGSVRRVAVSHIIHFCIYIIWNFEES
jgi:hypothetical protein